MRIREQLIEAATVVHDEQGCSCDRRYLMSCPRLASAILNLARTPTACCDMHNRHCEAPADLCCHDCTEEAHDMFPIRHADGSRCVMEGQ